MKLYNKNDSDLIEAIKELDTEFPGVVYDASLRKYLEHREIKKIIIRKIFFHGFFLAVFTAMFSFFTREHSIGLFVNMMWALSWFAFYHCFKDMLKYMKIRNRTQGEVFIGRPCDRKSEN